MRRYYYGFDIAYYSFQEDSTTKYKPESISVQNGLFVSSEKGEEFSIFRSRDSRLAYPSLYWKDITFESSYDTLSGYTLLTNGELLQDYTIYVSEKEYKAIMSFYDIRNLRRKYEKSCIEKNITKGNLAIAENLILSYVDDELFNSRILYHVNAYSSENINSDWKYYDLNNASTKNTLKGKAKKEWEEREKLLKQKLSSFLEYFFFFLEMVAENNSVNLYISYAISWYAIRIKSIELYSRRWEELYSIFLDGRYSEPMEQNEDSENAKIEYIKTVLKCEDISFSDAKGCLIYYFISKEPAEIKNIAEYFRQCERLINKAKNDLKNDEIKNKLKTKQIRKPVKYSIDDIDLMTGKEFEEFIGIMFRKLGYSTKITQSTGDQGIDVIAVKSGNKIGIQAKCYSSNVGNSAVQEAVAGKGYYSCDKVMVITNNYFTSSAIALAHSNNVLLWDRDFLRIKIQETFK